MEANGKNKQKAEREGVEIISVPIIHTDAHEVQRAPDPAMLVAIIEKRNEFIEKSLPIVIACTTAADWFDMGGKPYPGTSACQKIMERFGIATTDHALHKREGSDEKGSYYIYVYEANYLLVGFHSFHALGTCTSRDRFFAVSGGELRPLYEISEDNIIKAAKSNCDVNGTRGLLGFKSITWDELKACGLDRSKMSRVEYKGGKSEAPPKAAPKATAPAKASAPAPKQDESAELDRNELLGEWNMLCEYLQDRSDTDPEELCKKHLKFSKLTEDGQTYASMEMVQRFKKQPALHFLKKAIEAVLATVDVDNYKAFKAAGGVQSLD